MSHGRGRGPEGVFPGPPRSPAVRGRPAAGRATGRVRRARPPHRLGRVGRYGRVTRWTAACVRSECRAGEGSGSRSAPRTSDPRSCSPATTAAARAACPSGSPVPRAPEAGRRPVGRRTGAESGIARRRPMRPKRPRPPPRLGVLADPARRSGDGVTGTLVLRLVRSEPISDDPERRAAAHGWR